MWTFSELQFCTFSRKEKQFLEGQRRRNGVSLRGTVLEQTQLAVSRAHTFESPQSKSCNVTSLLSLASQMPVIRYPGLVCAQE